MNSLTPDLASESFGAVVESLNGVPIAVQQAMYWKSPSGKWSRGADAVVIPLQ